MSRQLVHYLLVLIFGACAAGCATTEALHTEPSSAAIRSAEELGAPDSPQASLHLVLAREEMQAAENLHSKGQVDEANSLLLRAEADAELAIALARVETEKSEAKAAMDRVRKLQSENPYAPGGAN